MIIIITTTKILLFGIVFVALDAHSKIVLPKVGRVGTGERSGTVAYIVWWVKPVVKCQVSAFFILTRAQRAGITRRYFVEPTRGQVQHFARVHLAECFFGLQELGKLIRQHTGAKVRVHFAKI